MGLAGTDRTDRYWTDRYRTDRNRTDRNRTDRNRTDRNQTDRNRTDRNQTDRNRTAGPDRTGVTSAEQRLPIMDQGPWTLGLGLGMNDHPGRDTNVRSRPSESTI